MAKWLAVCLMVFLSMTVAKADDPAFLSNLDDIPLMTGLTETEGGMHFDTPAGRIVESYAIGRVGMGDILAFYKSSLPSLGWRQVSGATFEREGEVLSLNIEQQEKNTVVRFALSPKS